MDFPWMVICKEAETLWVLCYFNSTLKINYFGVEVVVLDAFSLEISRKSGHVFLSFVGRVEISDRCHELLRKELTGEYWAHFSWLGHAGFCLQGSETQLTSHNPAAVVLCSLFLFERCLSNRSQMALPSSFLSVCFCFKEENATRCNLKPYDKFWPELGTSSVLLCSRGTEVANFS